eukprot:gene1032-618_t
MLFPALLLSSEPRLAHEPLQKLPLIYIYIYICMYDCPMWYFAGLASALLSIFPHVLRTGYVMTPSVKRVFPRFIFIFIPSRYVLSFLFLEHFTSVWRRHMRSALRLVPLCLLSSRRYALSLPLCAVVLCRVPQKCPIVVLYFLFFQASNSISPEPTRSMTAKVPPALPVAADIEAKVEAKLKEMTLDEKVGQMCEMTIDPATDWSKPEFALSPAAVDTYFKKYKIGSVLNAPYTQSQTPEVWVNLIRTLNHASYDACRGITQIYGVDQNHGSTYSTGGTLFPQEINQAASFNRDIVRRISEITAYEARACLIPWVYNPVMDLGRNPLWSRMWESYGEDVYVNAEMGVAATRAYQGEDPNHLGMHHVASCMKHYMAYGVPVNGKDRTPSSVTDREMREKFFEPYRRCVEAGALSVMINSALNNGLSFHANAQMIQGWLKDELNWDGMVVTDWNDVRNVWSRDHLTETYKEAIAMCVNAGIDMTMEPLDITFCDLLKELVQEGRVTMERVDDACRRILRLKYRVNLMDKSTWDMTPEQVAAKYPKFGSKEFADESVRIAEECIVLLKNEPVQAGGAPILPLKPQSKILVCGPNANTFRGMNGGWSLSWQGHLCDNVCRQLNKYKYRTFYEAIRDKFGAANVTLVEGVAYIKPPKLDPKLAGAPLPAEYAFDVEVDIDIESAVRAARDVDVIVACVGENSYCETPGNIDELSLSPNQLALVGALAETGKPVVLVLNEGRPRLITEVEPLCAATVHTMLPGTHGGIALANLLSGDANFSGRLPFTYPKHSGALATYDYKPCQSRPVMEGNYNYEAVMDVLYPFGAGMSYTTFTYSSLTVDKTAFKASDELHFSVRVKNTGSREGKEAVLLYTSDLVATITPDIRRLRAFTKISLQPGGGADGAAGGEGLRPRLCGLRQPLGAGEGRLRGDVRLPVCGVRVQRDIQVVDAEPYVEWRDAASPLGCSLSSLFLSFLVDAGLRHHRDEALGHPEPVACGGVWPLVAAPPGAAGLIRHLFLETSVVTLQGWSAFSFSSYFSAMWACEPEWCRTAARTSAENRTLSKRTLGTYVFIYLHLYLYLSLSVFLYFYIVAGRTDSRLVLRKINEKVQNAVVSLPSHYFFFFFIFVMIFHFPMDIGLHTFSLFGFSGRCESVNALSLVSPIGLNFYFYPAAARLPLSSIGLVFCCRWEPCSPALNSRMYGQARGVVRSCLSFVSSRASGYRELFLYLKNNNNNNNSAERVDVHCCACLALSPSASSSPSSFSPIAATRCSFPLSATSFLAPLPLPPSLPHLTTVVTMPPPPALPVDPKIEALVEAKLKELTLMEKIGQMCEITCDPLTDWNVKDRFALDDAAVDKVIRKYKVGSILNVPFSECQTPEVWINLIRTLNTVSMESCKGVTQLYGVDQIHGTTYSLGGTLFPQEISQAASFNVAIARRVAEVSAYESRACLIPWVYAPVLDIARNQMWSRMWESYGEDVLVNAEMGAAAVVGYQGTDPNHVGMNHVACSLKHYMAYGAPGNGKDRTPSMITDREMREKFFEPFRRGIEAGALSVMITSSVNNAMPFHCNAQMVKGWLKDELNWDGLVVSDWADVRNVFDRDHVAQSYKEAIELCVNAGVDMTMEPFDVSFCDLLHELVQEGRVTMERIDDACRRVLRIKYRLGLMDKSTWDFSVKEVQQKYPKYGCDEHGDEAVKMAEECMHTTPGVRAEREHVPRDERGGWTCSWQGHITDAVCRQLNKHEYKTFYDGLREKFGAANVTLVEGVSYAKVPPRENPAPGSLSPWQASTQELAWHQETPLDMAAVLKASEKADVIIACVGENSYTETPGNINDLALSEQQQALVSGLAKTGKPVVLVLCGGRPPHHPRHRTALRGDDQHLAARDVRRRSVREPSHPGALETYDYKPCQNRAVMEGNYNYDAVMDVLYPFGAGLSYTEFQYTDLKVNKKSFKNGDTLTFSVHVKNAGKRAGKEAVLLFVSDCAASVSPDVRRLRAFTKIDLDAGESKEVTLTLKASDLAFVGYDNHWVLEKGAFVATCGGQFVEFECSETYKWSTPNLLVDAGLRHHRDEALGHPEPVACGGVWPLVAAPPGLERSLSAPLTNKKTQQKMNHFLFCAHTSEAFSFSSYFSAMWACEPEWCRTAARTSAENRTLSKRTLGTYVFIYLHLYLYLSLSVFLYFYIVAGRTDSRLVLRKINEKVQNAVSVNALSLVSPIGLNFYFYPAAARLPLSSIGLVFCCRWEPCSPALNSRMYGQARGVVRSCLSFVSSRRCFPSFSFLISLSLLFRFLFLLNEQGRRDTVSSFWFYLFFLPDKILALSPSASSSPSSFSPIAATRCSFPLSATSFLAPPSTPSLPHLTTVVTMPPPPALPVDPKIEALVEAKLKELTLMEKIGQMCEITCDPLTDWNVKDRFALDDAAVDKVIRKYKVGSILNVPFSECQTPEVWINLIRTLNTVSMESCKGVTQLYGVDQIHGTTYSLGGTLFPQEISQAASFNVAIARRVAEVSAYESRACLIPWVYAPVLDIARNQMWSRMWESYGEDVLVNAEMGAAAVVGYQGTDPNHVGMNHVACSLKHYMAYGAPGNGKDRTPSMITDREMREKFFEPFRRGIEAGALSVMITSSVNNAMPFHCNAQMVKGWLKDELNWDGLVVSDWADVRNVFDRDHVAQSYKEAIELCVNAGVDMTMEPFDVSFCDLLHELVQEGRVTMERIDDACRRVLRIKYRLGLMDKSTWDFSVKEVQQKYPKYGCDEHGDEAVKMAEECMVLLKNNKVNGHPLLPLPRSTRLLVCGPNANTFRGMNGGWTCSWQGHITDAVCRQLNKHEYKTFYDGLREKFGAANVTLVEGVSYAKVPPRENPAPGSLSPWQASTQELAWHQETPLDMAAVLKASEKADVIIACVGENSYTETPGNINDLALSEQQQALVSGLAKTGKPVVLVLCGGRPRIIRDIEPLCAATINTSLPGTYGGAAFANLLASALHVPKHPGALETYDYKPCQNRAVMEGNYNYDAVMDVLYPFGAGLSYTEFQYTDLKVNKKSFKNGDTLTFSVHVKNAGKRAGKEAVLLFVSDCAASVSPDVRRLRAFTKIDLDAGESKEVTLTLKASDLAFVGYDNHWVLEKGAFVATCGGQFVEFECSETYKWSTPNRTFLVDAGLRHHRDEALGHPEPVACGGVWPLVAAPPGAAGLIRHLFLETSVVTLQGWSAFSFSSYFSAMWACEPEWCRTAARTSAENRTLSKRTLGTYVFIYLHLYLYLSLSVFLYFYIVAGRTDSRLVLRKINEKVQNAVVSLPSHYFFFFFIFVMIFHFPMDIGLHTFSLFGFSGRCESVNALSLVSPIGLNFYFTRRLHAARCVCASVTSSGRTVPCSPALNSRIGLVFCCRWEPCSPALNSRMYGQARGVVRSCLSFVSSPEASGYRELFLFLFIFSSGQDVIDTALMARVCDHTIFQEPCAEPICLFFSLFILSYCCHSLQFPAFSYNQTPPNENSRFTLASLKSDAPEAVMKPLPLSYRLALDALDEWFLDDPKKKTLKGFAPLMAPDDVSLLRCTAAQVMRGIARHSSEVFGVESLVARKKCSSVNIIAEKERGSYSAICISGSAVRILTDQLGQVLLSLLCPYSTHEDVGAEAPKLDADDIKNTDLIFSALFSLSRYLAHIFS